MKVCAISDLHGLLPELEPCDLVLIAGDISPLNIQQNMPLMDSWLFNKFIPWINNLDCSDVILVAGNHDFWFERASESSILLLQSETNYKLKYLCNQSYDIIDDDGSSIKIFGTPWSQIYGNWAFQSEDILLYKKFKEIPENIDILITHTPLFGITDQDVSLQKNQFGKHIGCKELTLAIDRLKNKPKLIICGHIHSGSHELIKVVNTSYVNVSLLDEYYDNIYKPFYTIL